MPSSDDDEQRRSAEILSKRLVELRNWLKDEAGATVHQAISIVNGEATDGTRNAPVLVYEKTLEKSDLKERVGVVSDGDETLYDRTMGCQIRATRELKKDEKILEIPKTSMITPEIIAASDAGRAVAMCCEDTNDFSWSVFENTTVLENAHASKLQGKSGPAQLVKIVQERKRAAAACAKPPEQTEWKPAKGVVSTRAPFLAFLIQQRFGRGDRVPVNVSNPTTPGSFSPYVRVFPSCVSVPLCWKRNELSILANCFSGTQLLLDVGQKTLSLVAEFIGLVDAGILHRFSDTFPPGLITWDRWVWAAAVYSSRLLPASFFFEDGNIISTATTPEDVWREMGVLVPLIDMLNHESDNHQITCLSPTAEDPVPRAIAHAKVKKGSELFSSYGNLSNVDLISQFGFAQMNNPSDDVKMGWSIHDAVGNVDPPFDFDPPWTITGDEIFESNDETAAKAWWTEERFNLLVKECFSKNGKSLTTSIKGGQKTITFAYCNETYDPILLSIAVVATMPAEDVLKYLAEGTKVVVTRRHQKILQRYLQFMFIRKMEKLLQNLNHGLKSYSTALNLWTKISKGGLNYQPKEDEPDEFVGWQSFFDAHAYKATMEVENRYYAMGYDSCVLTLYDGQLRCLQLSLDGVINDVKYQGSVLRQLEDLDFLVLNEEKEGNIDGTEPEVKEINKEQTQVEEMKTEESAESDKAVSSQNGQGSKSPKSRKRNRKKNSSAPGTVTGASPGGPDKPPAIKLHVGNLAYSTTPSDLYDYFSSIYGQDNVLECHIPVERETGKSRGFGFVAMPEEVAMRALQSGRKHEVHNRILKVAKSNSAGSAIVGKPSQAPPPVPVSDRCLTCGYRPRYCACPRPNIPGQKVPFPPPPMAPYGPPPGLRGPPGPDFILPHPEYGRSQRDYDHDRYRDDRRRDYDYDRHGDYDRDRRYRYDDDYRRDRDDDYYRERRRDRRSRSDSRGRYDDDRSSSRRRKEDSDDYEYERRKRSRSRSRSKDKSSRRKKGKRRNRSRSASPL
jgi:RNA recognition motif-containing protein